jgi:hypothetical protein
MKIVVFAFGRDHYNREHGAPLERTVAGTGAAPQIYILNYFLELSGKLAPRHRSRFSVEK